MKKQNQLGMNPSTASGRLVKDLLFKFVSIHHPNCYNCGEPLTRETFSIEHKTPWLDSDDPAGLYFDLDNIDFSHHICNIKQARKPWKHESLESKREAKNQGQREVWNSRTLEERKALRRMKYERYGK